MRKKRSYHHLGKMQNSRCRWTNPHLLKTAELASSSSFHSQSERPREASRKDAPSLSTACATFKVILGFTNMGIFFGSQLFFLIILANYNPFR